MIPAIVSAQRVGVVLSGGGSSGLAHVGVLKALEEAHIPIDYIAGTSMGALVGAIMKSSQGKADGKVVTALLQKKRG